MEKTFLKYNAQVPRYTSYPTAPHFQAVAESTYAESLAALDAGQELSLYIHIPYCKEMCWYCGCHTTATRKYAPVEDYLSFLLREIRGVEAEMPARMKVAHLHFGGGSPSMLQPDDFSRLMETLRTSFEFSADAEICVEADPRGLTHDKAVSYAEAGVTRMSFGIQDFSSDVQRAINRLQSAATVQKAVELARSMGIGSINFDLMYGLPRQSEKDVEETIYKSLQFNPDRVAFFGYAHVPWMKKHMRLIREADLPDATARLRQFARGEGLLTAAGMVAVGLDHFVRIGDSMHEALRARKLIRNFQGYSTDRASALIGLGMSSISALPDAYYQNHSNITEYSASVLHQKHPAWRGHRLTDEDRLRRAIISDLMCYFEVDVRKRLLEFSRAPDSFEGILASMAGMEADGLIVVRDGVVTVHQEMRQAVRIVAALFDAYFSSDHKRHVQAA